MRVNYFPPPKKKHLGNIFSWSLDIFYYLMFLFLLCWQLNSSLFYCLDESQSKALQSYAENSGCEGWDVWWISNWSTYWCLTLPSNFSSPFLFFWFEYFLCWLLLLIGRSFGRTGPPFNRSNFQYGRNFRHFNDPVGPYGNGLPLWYRHPPPPEFLSPRFFAVCDDYAFMWILFPGIHQ